MSYSALFVPTSTTLIYREECTQCFDNQDGELGIDVCLTCFNGSCPHGSTNNHSQQHYQKSHHPFFLNIRRLPIPSSRRDSSEPPQKLTKLSIQPEKPDSEKYYFVTTARGYTTDDGETVVDLPKDDKRLEEITKVVLSSPSSNQVSEVKAWEEEIVECAHTKELVQPEAKVLEPSGLATCSHPDCTLNSNLWLCLTCGSLGCGRQQFGGTGGNGHAMIHTHESNHPVAVKLGTITPEGGADVYCYKCDEPRLDHKLADHLKNFGINVGDQRKTEKSLTELQIEQNLVFDFAMTGSDGKSLEPITGPGLTGLKNLGNSCYIASSLQSLFSLPKFHDYYLTEFFTHSTTCTCSSPATCFDCQMSKIADGLLSGRYSVTSTAANNDNDEESGSIFQEGIKPIMFKTLVGKNHPDFATMKQQDSSEFLLHLFELIRKSFTTGGQKDKSEDPTTQFEFLFEEKIKCNTCYGVRVKDAEGEFLPLSIPAREKIVIDGTGIEEGKEKEYEKVDLKECLEIFTGETDVEWRCPKDGCGGQFATKSTKFSTLPETLIITPNRFPTINWVPKKIEIPLEISWKNLDLSEFLGKGLGVGEVELPDSDDSDIPAGPVFNEDALNQLTMMGFPEIRSKRALLATGNSGNAEESMNWLFSHMEDPDIDDPLPVATTAKGSAGPSDEQIDELVQMGFTKNQGRKALRLSGGDIARAIEWVFNNESDTGEDASSPIAAAPLTKKGFSTIPANYRLQAFISHKGPSPHSGHYVAHVWKGEELGWVLFNDEKVVKANKGEGSAEEWMGRANVYFFRRVE